MVNNCRGSVEGSSKGKTTTAELHSVGFSTPAAVMKQQHARTLQALFNHPLKHDLRVSDVEALLKHLEIAVEPLADHRLRVQLPSGEMMVLHAAAGSSPAGAAAQRRNDGAACR